MNIGKGICYRERRRRFMPANDFLESIIEAINNDEILWAIVSFVGL